MAKDGPENEGGDMDAAKLGEFYDYVTKVKGINGKDAAMPPAYIADRPEWIERMGTGRVVDGYFVYATTMSVLRKGGQTVAVNLFILNPESFEYIDQNATLRLSVGGLARIYGLSRDITASEEMDEEDMGIDDVEDGGKVPFTAAMEREAIRQLAESLKAQFADPMFKDDLPEDEKSAALEALKRS